MRLGSCQVEFSILCFYTLKVYEYIFRMHFQSFSYCTFLQKRGAAPAQHTAWNNPEKEVALLQKGSWGVCSCKNLTQEGGIVRSLWIRLQTWGFWECAYKVKVSEMPQNKLLCHRIKCWCSTASSVPLAATSSMVRELGGGKLFPDVAAYHYLLVCSRPDANMSKATVNVN